MKIVRKPFYSSVYLCHLLNPSILGKFYEQSPAGAVLYSASDRLKQWRYPALVMMS